MSDHLAAAPFASPAVESRQHLLPFADHCVALRLDDQGEPELLRRQAIALTEAVHGAVRGIGFLSVDMPSDNSEKEHFLTSMLTLVEFALGASVALQFDANEATSATRGAA